LVLLSTASARWWCSCVTGAKEYDYVVVGAGSAGCVIAARLSEDPSARVVVLEAGPVDDSAHIDMPLTFSQLFKSRLDWDFDTEPEMDLGGRTMYLAQGKVVGGSSSINAMIYARGSREDFDDWAADGAVGWSYEDVLPYFRRAEDNDRGEDRFHGVGGPLAVSDGRSRHPLSAAFLEAAIEAGVLPNPDINGASQEGVGYYQLTQRDGRRCSAAKAYLHPALARENLDLLTDTAVLDIVFEGERAAGVRVLRHGEVATIRASTEVILCAGAYQSPQILMLSGIGPPSQLSALGIPVRADLPVGEGLQDHLMTMIVYRTDHTSLLGAFTPESITQYEQFGRGPLTSNSGEAGGFIRVDNGSGPMDVQIYGVPAMFGASKVTEHGVSISSYAAKPTSRGSVTLRTAEPLTKPYIQHNYLASGYDRRISCAAVRRVLDIVGQPAFKGATTGPYATPESDTDEAIMAFIERTAVTTWHPVGTCGIGRVVDETLRVRGAEGLRVADASVMPSLIRGNTNAATIMIGEKAADLVRKG